MGNISCEALADLCVRLRGYTVPVSLDAGSDFELAADIIEASAEYVAARNAPNAVLNDDDSAPAGYKKAMLRRDAAWSRLVGAVEGTGA